MGKNLKSQISNLKSTWGWVSLMGLGILILFFLLRVFNLTILPVFVDEAIYIRWSQVMRAEPTLRFLPLSDGKQPLFMWLVIPFLKFISDPLVAGRMVSVLSGLGTLLGIFFLTLELFKSKKTALFSSLVYALVPFAVFFDRLALVDSLLTMFGVWVFYLGVLLVRYQRLDLAMVTGMILGGALLTKSPAIFFALLLPTTAILLSIKLKREFFIQLIKLGGLWSVVYFFAYAIYNIQRLGPNFQMIALRNKDYVFPLSHAWTNPLDPFQFHLVEIWQWLGMLLTWPVFFLSLVGIFFGLKKWLKPLILILFWLGFPLFVQAELAKVFTARYLLFSVPLLLVLAGLGFSCINTLMSDKFGWWQRKGSLILWPIILALPFYFDFLLLTNPQKAPLPRRERSGYLEEWTAGTGIKEAALYLRQRAKFSKVVVGTEGYFGTLPDGLQIYLERVPKITVVGVGFPISKVPQPLEEALIENEVYLLVNDSRFTAKPETPGFNLLASYPKATKANGAYESLLFFRIEKTK